MLVKSRGFSSFGIFEAIVFSWLIASSVWREHTKALDELANGQSIKLLPMAALASSYVLKFGLGADSTTAAAGKAKVLAGRESEVLSQTDKLANQASFFPYKSNRIKFYRFKPIAFFIEFGELNTFLRRWGQRFRPLKWRIFLQYQFKLPETAMKANTRQTKYFMFWSVIFPKQKLEKLKIHFDKNFLGLRCERLIERNRLIWVSELLSLFIQQLLAKDSARTVSLSNPT